MNHESYMRRALALARRAEGQTSPNPMVGAVIVKDGTIVGEGWHHRAGTPHAEIHAINQAGDLAKDATLYVTLEPCSHYGRTGPCVQAIVQAGITRVVAAMTDPNPLVAGQGFKFLRENGVEVIEGVLATEAAQLNEVFIKWITTKMPFGILKTAMSLDGKIATYTGHSRWITGLPARTRVHEWRSKYDAILVGVGTVVADNPELTARLIPNGKNPLRIVADSLARTPLNAKIVTDGKAPTIIAVTPEAPSDRIAALKASGAEVIQVARGPDGIDLRSLFAYLGSRSVTSVMIEGGGALGASALAANVVDKVYWFIAPKIIGGRSAPGPIGGMGAEYLEQAVELENTAIECVGEDFLVTAYIKKREGRDVYRTCGRVRPS
ncbi:riboflavin biosynthesis protein RibD [Thermosinus carboxydivorans Nor1]|uniref:Riboflavin biosynthesis protein RibD n=1 Tax=Thermosinus carboxydivorans Nor1 TaxID=401526 RepID=A1HMW4_9FIRM|nr:bifunctional diaminohydroxyphosphoribosylaminopyrimidine deaminase/5-amino-6-(5-phosphoribosylamino)uracil reductase RibD [Thermosinus carboxydivorans]EAX48596.1 riboflavin biosynthesis protein RibD [Thermosinus carboxydivorans Nor1]